MKRLQLLATFAIGLLLTINVASAQQVPQGFAYQGIARNAAGEVLAGQSVELQISVIDGGTNTAEYVETHTVTTNAFGLFTLTVGTGNAVTGTFGDIDWSTGLKLLGVEADFGSGMEDLGTSQLESVPYALVAGDLSPDADVTLGDLADVSDSPATPGQVIKWDGTQWLPAGDDAGFELPFIDSASTTQLTPLFGLRQGGTGPVMMLQQGTALSESTLLVLENEGQGYAIHATSSHENGATGYFANTDLDNTRPVIEARTRGVGNAGNFQIINRNSDSAAVRAFTEGTGAGVYGESSGAGRAYGVQGVALGECVLDQSGLRRLCPSGVYGVSRRGAGVYGHNLDLGPGVLSYSENGMLFVGNGPSGNPGFADMKFYVDNSGQTYGENDFLTEQTYHSSQTGAVSQRFTAGDTGIAAGDVVMVDPSGAVVQSNSANSAAVIGIVVANSALVGGTAIDESGQVTNGSDLLVASSGVVMVNVSDENGQIAPGDLLVASSTPGYAMKAGPAAAPAAGTVIAKALQSFTANGNGTIRAVIWLR